MNEIDLFDILKEPAPIIDAYGNKFWYNTAGELHRDNDLPAMTQTDGYAIWYRNGRRHRDNGKPAVMFSDRSVMYFVDGVRILR